LVRRLREIAVTKINRSFLATVPSAVRAFLGLDWGDRIVWCVKGDEIVVKKEEKPMSKKRPIERLRESDQSTVGRQFNDC